MRFKTLAAVTGGIIALAVIVLAVRQFAATDSPGGRVGKPLLQSIDLDRAARISIRSHQGTVTLQRKGGARWTVAEQGDFPVDARALKQLLVKLNAQKVAHRVTAKKDRLAGLALLTAAENEGEWEPDKTGVLLEIFDDQNRRMFGLLIGRDRSGENNTGFGGTYVRFAGEPEAYLVSESVLRDFKPKDWIDKVVFDEDGDTTVKAIRIRKGQKGEVRLERQEPGDRWRMNGAEPAALDQDEVKNLANLVAGLEISRVADPGTPPAELGRARTSPVEVEFFDRRRILIDIGHQKAGDQYRYLTIRTSLPGGVGDEALRNAVRAFNDRFAGRTLGIYDWDGGRLLQQREDFLAERDGDGRES